jgi:hypothetical protein
MTPELRKIGLAESDFLDLLKAHALEELLKCREPNYRMREPGRQGAFKCLHTKCRRLFGKGPCGL